jgi:uncharacterized protein YukE
MENFFEFGNKYNISKVRIKVFTDALDEINERIEHNNNKINEKLFREF